MDEKKSRIYGIIGTIIVNGLLLLLLFIYGLNIDPPFPKEEGIEIMFGDGLDGTPGETVSQTTQEIATSVPPPPQPEQVTNNPDVLTQDDPNSLAIEAEKKKKVQKQQEEIKEKKRQEEIKRQEIVKAQQEAARIAAENKRKADAVAKAGSAASGAFGSGGNGTSGTGNGSGGTGTSPGNPMGKGSQGGNSWSLSGRSLTSPFFKPSYVGNSEGKITIIISVDKNGKVVNTSVDYKNTNISEEGQLNECKAAARKLGFNANPKQVGNVQGNITYNFKLQ